MRDYRLQHDGSQTLRVLGTDRREAVGFELGLGPEWKDEPHLAGTILAVQMGAVTFRSIGKPSDALLSLLDRVFQTGFQPNRMKQSVESFGLALGGSPAHLEAGTTRIKLSYEADNNTFDLFTLIDIPSGLVRIQEKDSCFRSAVMHALAAPGAQTAIPL